MLVNKNLVLHVLMNHYKQRIEIINLPNDKKLIEWDVTKPHLYIKCMYEFIENSEGKFSMCKNSYSYWLDIRA